MDAMKPLDGARLKVVRAEEHLHALKNEVGQYLDSKPYEIPVERGIDTITARPAVIKSPPPLRLSCIIGDCVGCLRSSLDYIAWEIATRYGSPSPVVGKNKDIFFPILESATGDGPDRFAKMTAKWSFPAMAIDEINSVQPYHAGNDPLATLNRLVNHDKHCLPLLTIGCVQTHMLSIIAGKSWSTASSGISKHTMYYKAPKPGLSAEQPGDVKVDGEFTIFVSFQNQTTPLVPVDRTIEDIVKFVADIVPRFEQFV